MNIKIKEEHITSIFRVGGVDVNETGIEALQRTLRAITSLYTSEEILAALPQLKLVLRAGWHDSPERWDHYEAGWLGMGYIESPQERLKNMCILAARVNQFAQGLLRDRFGHREFQPIIDSLFEIFRPQDIAWRLMRLITLFGPVTDLVLQDVNETAKEETKNG